MALSIAFFAYACNLVNILEHLSGKCYRLQATLGGFLAVLYAWVIFFGTLAILGWFSGLNEAFNNFFKEVTDNERQQRQENA